MEKDLERIIEAFGEVYKMNEKDIEKIRKQVSYLDYAFYDVLNQYDDGKININSLIIFFAYFFGNILNDDEKLRNFVTILYSVYAVRKVRKKTS